MAPSNETRQAFRFFHEHAGGIVGRSAETALELARAEALLREAEELDAASVEWVDDSEPYDFDPSVDSPEYVARQFESGAWTGPFGCIVKVGDEERSLWGIVLGSRGTNDPYARVVVAELASELLEDMREAVRAKRTNDVRSERAYRAVLAYYDGNDDIEAGISDLAADLLHLAAEYGVDPEQLQRRAWHHYVAETILS